MNDLYSLFVFIEGVRAMPILEPYVQRKVCEGTLEQFTLYSLFLPPPPPSSTGLDAA